MARSLARAVLVAALAAGSAAGASVCSTGCVAAPAGSGALFLFSGHGWGHGVGMSQYGAYGYAQHGAGYREILAHYYPGTTLAPAPARTIRVLLADRKKTLRIGSDVAFTVRDGAGRKHALAAGTVSFGVGLKLPVDGRARPTALPAPLTFVAGRGGPLSLGRPYRGRISVDVVDGRLRAIDVVGLEQYLAGVVPAEMPSSWAPEALKAQAVAARSYALATRAVGAPFDVYSDTRSQVYLGISQESPAATAAVEATRRQVLTYDGKVATTYFSSTSGGQTESALDWSGVAVPYLVSVPDPYDAISPYHDWGPVPVTARTIAKALKVPGAITDATTTPNAAGRVAQLRLVTPTATVPVPGTKLRTALRLRSTWFSVGVLSLVAPPVPVTYGSAVTLSGAVRRVAGVELEQRTAGEPWQPVGPVATGALQLAQKPTVTTDYRLATSTAAAAYVRVKVAPAVSIQSFTSTGVDGSVQPVLPDAPVEVQQQSADGTWSTVATGAVGDDGSFAVAAQLTPGATYRISVAPGHGYVPAATTPQLVVR